MNDTQNKQITISGQHQMMIKNVFRFLAISFIAFLTACSTLGLAPKDIKVDPALQQAVFKSPDDAADTLARAVKNKDQTLLNTLLGTNFRRILPLSDVTSEDHDNFNKAWEEHHTLIVQSDNTMLLAIGENKWTMPIPIVSGSSGWYFDVTQGLEIMRIRHIGRNELASMQTVLAYYDAQMEYSGQDRNGDGFLEYAQKFISTAGANDGLFWDVQPGSTLSPLGHLIADRTPGGGYHGYFYRILKAQGKHAKGGAYSYLIGNKMRAGFALIAWPEEYGESGVMSFIISHEGIVYEQNLGPEGADIAQDILVYDPAPEWIAVQEVIAPKASK